MRDPQRVKIRHKLFRISEAKVKVELNSVGGTRTGHGLGHPHSQLIPQRPKSLCPLGPVAARGMRLISIRRIQQHRMIEVLNVPQPDLEWERARQFYRRLE